MNQVLPHPTYDTLFKRMLQSRNRARAFIRACAPAELAGLISELPEPLDVRNFTQGGVLLECDALFRVRLDDGRCILAMLEHKSILDPRTLEQVCKYLFAIRFGGLADEEGNLSDLQVAPIVYYHGKEPWNIPESTTEGAAEIPGMGYSYGVGYRFVDPVGLETTELERNPDLRSATMIQRLLHLTDAEVSDSQLELVARGFAKSGFGEYLFICAMQLLSIKPDRLMKASKQVLDEEENVMPSVAKQIEMKGRAEGLAEGRAEGRADALLDLLRFKFDDVSEGHQRKIKRAGLDQIARWSGAVLTATTIEEVFSGQSSAS